MVQGLSGHFDSFLPTPPVDGAYVRGLTGPCELWTDPCRMDALSAGKFVYDNLPAAHQAVAAYACRAASGLLWRRSGRLPQLAGRCVHTIRPLLPQSCGCADLYRREQMHGHSWFLSCSSCGCRQPAEFQLPRKPVTGIVEVVIDGLVLASTAYAVAGYDRLLRLDGSAWPGCQDRSIRDASALGVDPTDEELASRLGTWLVRYQVGTRVPDDAADVAAIVALELYWSRVDAKNCRVPLNASTVTKGGVSVTKSTATEDTLLELIPEAKAWLRAVNPNDAGSRAMAFSPARRRRREQIRT